MNVRQKKTQNISEGLTLAEQRSELARFISDQRRDERGGEYQDSYIHRGLNNEYATNGDGYNQIHAVRFEQEVDQLLLLRTGIIRVLDVGCGLGYFLRDIAKHVAEQGQGDRLDLSGVTLTRSFTAIDTASGEPMNFKPVMGPDCIRVAHAEKLPFEDNSFDMVVSTMGPYTYYDGPFGAVDRQKKILTEIARVTKEDSIIYLATNQTHYEREYGEGPLRDLVNERRDLKLIKDTVEDDRIRIQIKKCSSTN